MVVLNMGTNLAQVYMRSCKCVYGCVWDGTNVNVYKSTLIK